MKLAILGIGSIRCGIPVIASLATYFGERQLDVCFYDPDEERLDLFDRLARVCFAIMKSTHTIRSTSDLDEALDGAQRVVVQLDAYGVSKELGRRATLAQAGQWLADALSKLEVAPEVLDLAELDIQLARPVSIAPDWPAAPDLARPFMVPLQILRWLNGEEYPFEVFREQEKSPMKLWLDDPANLGFRMPQTGVIS